MFDERSLRHTMIYLWYNIHRNCFWYINHYKHCESYGSQNGVPSKLLSQNFSSHHVLHNLVTIILSQLPSSATDLCDTKCSIYYKLKFQIQNSLSHPIYKVCMYFSSINIQYHIHYVHKQGYPQVNTLHSQLLLIKVKLFKSTSTHWGRVTHNASMNCVLTGQDNG